nr:K(+)-transporting ATPase subunit C [Tissierella sp.]
MKRLLKEIKTPFLVTLILFLICGLIYPLLLTGVSQLVFAKQANGSLISINDEIVGSSLIGQDFTDARFIKGRPSAVKYNTYTLLDKENGNYNGVGSGSNNYSTSNEELSNRVKEDIDEFLEANPSIKIGDIPTDLLTESGSGLDPHISPESALIQVPQIAKNTNLSEDRLIEIIKLNTKEKLFGIFGEETVNILEVNLQIAQDLKLISKKNN